MNYIECRIYSALAPTELRPMPFMSALSGNSGKDAITRRRQRRRQLHRSCLTPMPCRREAQLLEPGLMAGKDGCALTYWQHAVRGAL